MLTSISHRFTSRTLLRLSALLVVVATLPSCVPYVRYEDAIAKLNRTVQVNQDLERRMRDAQIDDSAMGGDLKAATARIGSLEAANSSLELDNARLRAEIETLNELREGLVAIDFPDTPLEVNRDTGGVILPNDVLFPAGKFQLRKEATAVLDQLYGLISSKYSDRIIVVDGHTDNTPINSSAKVNKDNWDLASKRAHAVFAYFKGKGIPETQMAITSRGYAQPVSNVDVNSKAGRSQCRRVEIRIRESSY